MLKVAVTGTLARASGEGDPRIRWKSDQVPVWSLNKIVTVQMTLTDIAHIRPPCGPSVMTTVIDPGSEMVWWWASQMV
jgi:hypothetical protein